MSSAATELLCDFTLPDKGRAALEDFFNTKFDDLRHRSPEAMAQLQIILREELPKEALDNFIGMFTGQSKTAVLLHNLPERKGFENWSHEPKPEDTYSYFISNAIYAMHGAKSKLSQVVSRRKETMRGFFGNLLHRDFATIQTFGAFACPYNGENATTSVIALERAIESIPESTRAKIMVKTLGEETAYSVDEGNHGPYESLNDVLAKLQTPGANSFNRVTSPLDPEARKIFDDAIARHSVEVNLQPGDLLFIDERHLFHHAHKGDITKVSRDHSISRLVMRNVAASSAHGF